jgi:hypothetical protein
MHRSPFRALRSPAVSTIVAIVLGLSGIAVAGSQAPDDAGEPEHGRANAAANAATGASHAGGAHGEAVSTFARDTDLEGWRKGAAIADLASGGKSQAGEHGPHAGQEPGAPDGAPNANAQAGQDRAAAAGSAAPAAALN